MKISNVRTHSLEAPLDSPIFDARFRIASRRAVLVEIETDQGLRGVGEAACFGGPPAVTARVVEEELAPLILGRNPFLVEGLWSRMYSQTAHHGRRGIVISALSGIDVALWDLIAKACGQPLYRVLGAARDRVPAYASCGFYRDGGTLKDLQMEMGERVREGFRGVKIKIGRNGPLDDQARVRAAREELGPDVRLMVDANNALDLYTALKTARLLEPYDPYWFEEPVHPDFLEDCREMARRSTIPIAGYEIEYTRFGFLPLIRDRLVAIAQPDVTWSGGFTECRRIAAMAATYGVRCIPHAFSSAVALTANLHFAASIAGESWIEFDRTNNPLRSDLAGEPPAIENGEIVLSQKPGLGLELNSAVLERFRIV